MTSSRPTIAMSIGCPAGIGPEVAVLGALSMCDKARIILVGDRNVIERASELHGAKLTDQIEVWSRSTPLEEPPTFGEPTPKDGAAQLAWIDEATDLVRSGAASALVTGPVSKAVIASSGAPGAETFRGHTEHLGARLGAREVIMAFAGAELITALVTTHLALADVPRAVTPPAVAAAIYWLTRLVTALRGSATPRIAVASLNPHAGESGLLGREEIDAISPGIGLARERLANANIAAEIIGPIGAETAIRLSAKGQYGGVVTMYHDQATIPSKLLGFGEAVNVTMGLPIVRTSVDHGTGYDIAGTKKADPRGMIEAISTAIRISIPNSASTY